MSTYYKPQNTLRSQVMKNALKAFIVPAFLRKYNIVALRALWSVDRLSENSTIWKKRRELEVLLLSNDNIVAFFSCITALQEKKLKKNHVAAEDSGTDAEEDNSVGEVINFPGISFWIVCEWPECSLQKIETMISKQFLESGLNLLQCKAIRSRGISLQFCFCFDY